MKCIKWNKCVYSWVDWDKYIMYCVCGLGVLSCIMYAKSFWI